MRLLSINALNKFTFDADLKLHGNLVARAPFIRCQKEVIVDLRGANGVRAPSYSATDGKWWDLSSSWTSYPSRKGAMM